MPIFKEIYQEIVKRGERHRIGEYYTPEWLAELTLNEGVKAFDPEGKKRLFSVIDPACGSGTFLTNAISLLKKNGCSLDQIIDNVFGMDLNPLAVAISRANYLLALGKLIENRKGPLFIPVYMANSIKLPKVRKELISGKSILAIDATDTEQISLPLEIGLDEEKLKKILDKFSEILIEYRKKHISRNNVLAIFGKSRVCPKSLLPILEGTLNTLMDLIDDKQDSIWVFMLRNIYAPLRLREKKFDIVVGNPPWVSLRYIENSEYQNFMKKVVFNHELLKENETDLFTQMDTSTVFYVKVADVYLSDSGILSFVMPRSVLTGAKQHTAFRKQKKPLMRILKLLDTEKVNPLFNVDSCSIIARKGEGTVYPIPSVLISGKLPEKNIRLKKALTYLAFEESEYSPPEILGDKSPYHDKLQNGAGIYPRPLWVIEFVPGEFGLNPQEPCVKSLKLPDAKEPWKKVNLEGEVEKDFIFATVTGKNILPFKANYLPIVLPIRKNNRSWEILSSRELRKEGKFKMASWVDGAQKAWEVHATKKNLQNYPTPISYVNYNNKLIDQRIDHRFYVVYTAGGTNIASVIVDTHILPDFQVRKVKILPSGFVPDVKTFYFSTNDEQEALYLNTILNSTILDERIKPHQTRGKFGPRDIHRRPFEFYIPKFDQHNKIHMRLAFLGTVATKESLALRPMSRMKTKTALDSIKTIDILVKELMFKESS